MVPGDPWRSLQAVEYALEWVDNFDSFRFLKPVGNMPPAKAEVRHEAGKGGASNRRLIP